MPNSRSKLITEAKIEKMSSGGKILGEVLEVLISYAKPGVSELDLDRMAEELIKERGGYPGFKKVPGYNHSICVSVNDVVVHGIPTKRVLKEGDVLGIDCGVFYEGYHTDMAETITVQASKPKVKNDKIGAFLSIGKKALFEGINQARAGNRVGHISSAIERLVERSGYSIVHSLVGHGVGKKLHEKPEIPGYLSGPIEKTPMLSAGMTIAVEIIYNMGNRDVVYNKDDDWTIGTKDGSISGLFERTILVTDDKPKLLTAFSKETA